MATELVNTVTDLVDKCINFGPKKTTDDALPTPNTSDSDEDFEVYSTTTIVQNLLAVYFFDPGRF